MTLQDFLTEAQGYYGRYTGAQKKAVVAWLRQYPEKLYSYLYAEVLKTLSASYKTPPGIYELEQAMKTVKRERWSEIFPCLPEPLPEKADPEKMKSVIDLIKNLGKAKRFEEKTP